MSEIKLVFFDMEGTVFCPSVLASETKVAPSAWFTIAQRLGTAALEEERATQERWNSGRYSGYIEWMEDTVRIHAKYGLTRELFTGVLDSIHFVAGAREVFRTLHDAGVHTAIVSGGFKYQADRAAKEFGIKHVFAGCEYYWDAAGRLVHWNLLPADYKGKVDFMHSLSADYAYERTQLAFVGDGKNDVLLAREVGTSIAFNGPEELRQCCTRAVIQGTGSENLSEILPYLGFSHDDRKPNARVV